MDINKLMQQAQAMQKQLEKANEQINATEFEGSASNGLVKVVVNGENKVLSVSIDPSILNP
ncbi:MAG: YbaB/EbfC family nucleoid-associated protein [Erysipelotrichaceae bacterium]|nr:YbaB/EbfC family nucleoid-associated protein [Erysipelotrichaceae bacterium]